MCKEHSPMREHALKRLISPLARMEITLQLTKSHYKEATGKVNKTDYLYNKVIAESVRSALAELEKNEFLSQAALANIMGCRGMRV